MGGVPNSDSPSLYYSFFYYYYRLIDDS